MSDRDDDTGRRPKQWPLAGPIAIDPNEVTDRMTILDSNPATRAVLLRLQTQREEDRRALEHRIAELAEDMRKRDHAVRNDVSTRIESLAGDVREHVESDLKFHTDLVGASGSNGKLGTLTKEVSGWNEARKAIGTKMLGLVAGLVLSLGTAGTAIWAVAYKKGAADRDSARVADDVAKLQANQAAILAAMFRAGLISPALPASTSGDPVP